MGSFQGQAVLACVLAAAPLAHAFESYEHKVVGDLAIQFAAQGRACAALQDGNRRLCADLMPSAVAPAAPQEAPPPSYGDLVQCVDRFLTPEKMLVQLREQSSQPETKQLPELRSPYADPRKIRAGLRPGREACLFPVPLLDASTANASHGNHAHFQEELLLSLSAWHTLALGVARDQGNLPGALLLNAIASHYLHDLFAPGHIVTRRSEFTDTVATAMHDFHNHRGARFQLRETPGTSLQPALQLMHCVLEDDSKACKDVLAHTGPASSPLRADLVCKLIYRPGEDTGRCRREALGETDLQRVREVVAALLGGRRSYICMKGDFELWRHADGPDGGKDTGNCSEDGLYQRVYMVAMTLGSILDVLQAGTPAGEGKPAATNRFQSIAWDHDMYLRTAFNEQKQDYAWAATPFGYYYMGGAPGSGSLPDGWQTSPPRSGQGENGQPAAGLAGTVRVPPAAGESSTNDPGRTNFYFENLFRVSFGREAFYKGDRAGRNFYGLEVQPFWRPIHLGREHDAWNVGMSLGLVGTHDRGVSSRGLLVRVLTTSPKMESTFSAWLRRLDHYGYSSEQGWRWGYGVDYEQGFTSIFSVTLGMGRDYSAVPGGPLRQGTLFHGSIAITMPEGRIARLAEGLFGRFRNAAGER